MHSLSPAVRAVGMPAGGTCTTISCMLVWCVKSKTWATLYIVVHFLIYVAAIEYLCVLRHSSPDHQVLNLDRHFCFKIVHWAWLTAISFWIPRAILREYSTPGLTTFAKPVLSKRRGLILSASVKQIHSGAPPFLWSYPLFRAYRITTKRTPCLLAHR